MYTTTHIIHLLIYGKVPHPTNVEFKLDNTNILLEIDRPMHHGNLLARSHAPRQSASMQSVNHKQWGLANLHTIATCGFAWKLLHGVLL